MSAEQTSRTLSAALCASASRASTERSAKCLGISPPRYLTLRRLAGARYELLAGKPGAMVTEAPPRWGPFDLSCFSEAHAALFFELPSQALHAAGLPR